MSRLRLVSGVNHIASPFGRRESISRPTSFSSVQLRVHILHGLATAMDNIAIIAIIAATPCHSQPFLQLMHDRCETSSQKQRCNRSRSLQRSCRQLGGQLGVERQSFSPWKFCPHAGLKSCVHHAVTAWKVKLAESCMCQCCRLLSTSDCCGPPAGARVCGGSGVTSREWTNDGRQTMNHLWGATTMHCSGHNQSVHVRVHACLCGGVRHGARPSIALRRG